MGNKAWVEISKNNLVHNISEFKKLIGQEVKMMAVVKSNAYGHGLIGTAKVCEENGADWFGVDSVNEALELRKEGIKNPILVLGYTLFENLELAANNNISLIVYNKETIEKLGELDQEIKIHIKVETGTSRQGIEPKELPEFIDLIKKYPKIKIEGASTHFANIEDTRDHSYAEGQLEKFKEAIKIFEDAGIKIPIKHTACSAATILFPETYFNLVRVGISLYGHWSSGETLVSAESKNRKIDLKPCLTWKTKIAQIKTLKAGTPVSYGLTEKVSQDTKIAILPIGYWDGYDRGLSSVGNVLIKGRRCKILGRVCMNICIVDVSHVDDLQIEDEAVLLGKQGDEEITAEEIAARINTINYEVITRINPEIERIYTG